MFACRLQNMWIRQGAVGFVAAVARALNIADVHCNLLPLLQPFLKQPVIQVDHEVSVRYLEHFTSVSTTSLCTPQVVLLNALNDPLPRPIYDYVLRSPLIERLFETLLDRQLIRSLCRAGHQPTYEEVDEALAQLLRKLNSQGMQRADEDKLLVRRPVLTISLAAISNFLLFRRP